MRPVGWATHYHADYVVPYWAATMAKNAVVGAHLFYRWAGRLGSAGGVHQTIAAIEPSARALRMRSTRRGPRHRAGQPGSLAAAIRDIPGAEPLKLAPSLRGDKRVAVRFNLVARKASEEVQRTRTTRSKFDVFG